MTFIICWTSANFIKKTKHLRHFPGPFALPIVGNLYNPSALSIISYIKQMNKIHGKIFTFWPGPSPMLVVSDPNIARLILSNPVTFIKGSDYTEKFSVVFGDGLVTSQGRKHKDDRACFGRYFIGSNINKHLPMFVSETLRMMNEFMEQSLGKDINVEYFFHMLALRMFGKFSLSIDYGDPSNYKIAESINTAVKYGSNVVGEHIVLNIPMSPLFPRVQKLHNIVKWMDKYLDKVIDKRIEDMHNSKKIPEDILDIMLANGIPRDKMHNHLRTLLSAGHDTTAFFGCYMAYLLAKHPKVQDKIKKEISTVLKGINYIESDDIPALKYCRMVMQETLRMYSIIPFVNRTTATDYKIKDKDLVIPRGTVILVALSNMNRDSDIWDKPNEFIPERFHDMKSHCSAKHGYFPFCYGTRTCIGNTLALTEGVVMLALLMQRYYFYPTPGFKPNVIA